jgi:uncharacterized protein YecT (DUF1311 family)
MLYAPGMSRLHLFNLFLLGLTLCPLRGQDAASDQKTAAAALQFEAAQIGNDCGNAKNTEINSCLTTVAEKTQSNFRVFYGSLRSLLKPGSDAAQQLDSSQAQWEKYSSSACGAVDSFYRSGSIRIAAVTGCHIQLMRSRMQDLNALYITVLHL